MEQNFEGLEMQKWNIWTDSSKRDEKNGDICLVTIFTPAAIVIKMSKRRRNQPVWAKFVSTSERSYLAPSENAMDCWILIKLPLEIC